jgi:hypothetical protein
MGYVTQAKVQFEGTPVDAMVVVHTVPGSRSIARVGVVAEGIRLDYDANDGTRTTSYAGSFRAVPEDFKRDALSVARATLRGLGIHVTW